MGFDASGNITLNEYSTAAPLYNAGEEKQINHARYRHTHAYFLEVNSYDVNPGKSHYPLLISLHIHHKSLMSFKYF